MTSLNYNPRGQYNQYNERDPRWRYTTAPAPTAENAELYALRLAVLEQGRALPAPGTIQQINPSTEEQLKELWINCYVNWIEPVGSVNLESMTPLRRAKVTYWRDFFISTSVDMFRLLARVRNRTLNLSELIIQIWEDILEIKADELSRR